MRVCQRNVSASILGKLLEKKHDQWMHSHQALCSHWLFASMSAMDSVKLYLIVHIKLRVCVGDLIANANAKLGVK